MPSLRTPSHRSALGTIGLFVLGCAGPAAIDGVAEPDDATDGRTDETPTGGEPSPPDELAGATEIPCDGAGTLRLELTQTAASGARYRLQNATIDLNRLEGDFRDTLTTAAAPDPDRLEIPVESGEYWLTLNEGWSLVALDGDAPTVSAARLSPALLVARVGAGDDVAVRYRFEVEVPGVEPTPRAIAPTLGILERPAPPSGRVCIESPIAPERYTVYTENDLAALDGCREVRGELGVAFPRQGDLAALSRLERVCGTFTLARLAQVQPAEVLAEQSLAGLEALEEVDALHVYHPGVRSLAPLARLRRIQGREAGTDVEGLYIMASGLEDLSGLESVTQIQNLRVEQSDSLRSLRGLTLPSEMGSVNVSSANLADLAALEGVRRLSGILYITAGALEDLDALSSLRSADSVTIWGGALSDASGLRWLEATNELSLLDGPLEAGFPIFEALAEVGGLTLAGLGAPGVLHLPALSSVGRLHISDNSNLESVSAPLLGSVQQLTIIRNPALSAVELPALSSASAIDVTGNASLSDGLIAPLLELDAPTTRIGGNAGSSLPLDPCPWAGDGVCDEGYGLCAPDTDGDDCRID
jgi:hypothetical protein